MLFGSNRFRNQCFAITNEFITVSELSFMNMRYLTIDQMLEDIATFIKHLQSESEDEHNHIILWGSGTGASLATWAKIKYPQLVDAIWASSGVYSMLNISTNCEYYIEVRKRYCCYRSCALHQFAYNQQLFTILLSMDWRLAAQRIHVADFEFQTLLMSWISL